MLSQPISDVTQSMAAPAAAPHNAPVISSSMTGLRGLEGRPSIFGTRKPARKAPMSPAIPTSSNTETKANTASAETMGTPPSVSNGGRILSLNDASVIGIANARPQQDFAVGSEKPGSQGTLDRAHSKAGAPVVRNRIAPSRRKRLLQPSLRLGNPTLLQQIVCGHPFGNPGSMRDQTRATLLGSLSTHRQGNATCLV